MSHTTTHSLLLKSSATFMPTIDAHWHKALQTHFSCTFNLQSVGTAQAENMQPMHHVYLHLEKPQPLNAADAMTAEKIWRILTGHEAQVSRLQCVMQRPGMSRHSAPTVHYVVETDPEDGWQDEIFRWYDQEHLPGLSEVPGTVLAQRFLNLDHSPMSFACYDLTSAEVLTSPAWLAVRASAWSDICRPHFTNTLRTLFETIHTPLERKLS